MVRAGCRARQTPIAALVVGFPTQGLQQGTDEQGIKVLVCWYSITGVLSLPCFAGVAVNSPYLCTW